MYTKNAVISLDAFCNTSPDRVFRGNLMKSPRTHSYSVIFPTLIATRGVKFPFPRNALTGQITRVRPWYKISMSLFDRYVGVITLTGFYCLSVSRGDGRYYVSAVYLGVNRSLSLSGHSKNHIQTVWHRCESHVTNSVCWTHYQRHVSHVNYPRLITEICRFCWKMQWQ